MLLSSRSWPVISHGLLVKSTFRAGLPRRYTLSAKSNQERNSPDNDTEESEAKSKSKSEADSTTPSEPKRVFVRNIGLKGSKNSRIHSEAATVATVASVTPAGTPKGHTPGPTTRVKRTKPLRKVLVPMVPSTDHISIPDIQTEALYAGHRPLFLGNSTLQGSEYLSKYQPKFQLSPDLERELIDTFKRLVHGDDSGAKKFLKRLLRMPPYKILKRMDAGSPVPAETPIVPWMASISGLLYRDTAFKKIPNHVVAKLRPFEQIEMGTEGEDRPPKPTRDTIIMKVHNPRINDESEMVNIYNPPPMVGTGYSNLEPNPNNFLYQNQNGLIALAQTRARFRAARKQYMNEIHSLNYKYKFIVDDQLAIKNAASKLNKHLSNIFYERTKLNAFSDVRGRPLPFNMYLYYQNTPRVRHNFDMFIKKVIMREVTPIYTTLLNSFQSDIERNQFEKQVSELVSKTARNLTTHLPSVVFRDPTGEVECIVRSSPVPGFKRMYWLDPVKRRAVFAKRNSDLFFTWQLSVRDEDDEQDHVGESATKETKTTSPFTTGRVVRGTTSKYKMEPNIIAWETLSGVFDNWNFYTN